MQNPLSDSRDAALRLRTPPWQYTAMVLSLGSFSSASYRKPARFTSMFMALAICPLAYSSAVRTSRIMVWSSAIAFSKSLAFNVVKLLLILLKYIMAVSPTAIAAMIINMIIIRFIVAKVMIIRKLV